MNTALGDLLREWVEEFVLDLRRRNYSSTTLRVYRYDLLRFILWVEQQTQLVQPGDLSAAALEQYQMHLMLRPTLVPRASQPRPLTAATRNRHLAELRSFFRYLKKSCRLLSNPCLELEGARQSRRLPKTILSVPEMARLLGSVPAQSATGLRDLAALEILYGTGVRRFELMGLKLTDLRLEDGLVHVMGKGRRERVVPLGRAALKALKRYLKLGRPTLLKSQSNALLISSHHGEACSEHELLRALRKHARQAGIKKSVHFHLFRHTCATHLLRGGADLRSIQVLLGHAHLNTTAIYTHVEVAELQKTIQRYHPRERSAPPT